MGGAPPGEQGVASGVLATFRVIGQSLSVAVAGTVFAGFGAAAAGSALPSGRGTISMEWVVERQQTFQTGLRAAFSVCAGIAAMGVVIALVRGRENQGMN